MASITAPVMTEHQSSLETRLWQAVIVQTIQEWISGPLRFKREAEHYLFEDQKDFQLVCQSAGMDVARLRSQLRRLQLQAMTPRQIKSSILCRYKKQKLSLFASQMREKEQQAGSNSYEKTQRPRGGTLISPVRHRAQRHPFVAGIQVTAVDTDASIAGHTEDLSLFGCFVVTATPFAAGTRVQLRISHRGVIFNSQGTVAHSRDNAGMGIAFTAVEPNCVSILDAWLTELRNS